MISRLITVAIFVILSGVAVGGPDADNQERGAGFPLCFIENRGQLPSPVAYYVKGREKSLYFTNTGVSITLHDEAQRWIVELDFVGARADASPRGTEPVETVFNYFRGEPTEWQTECRSYAGIVYEDLWPGIDLRYRAADGALKYEFLVDPGVDPQLVRLRYRGATNVRVEESGELVVATPAGRFEDARPVAYQEDGGVRTAVSMGYAPDADAASESFGFAFELGPYDPSKTLVMDPSMILYCGYVGGFEWDEGWGVAVDDEGCAYLTGLTSSDELTFPVTTGPDLTWNGGNDCFVAKVNAAGTALVYCGYIGGSENDYGSGIAVDSKGCAHVTGTTNSDENSFPVTVGPDLTFNGAPQLAADIFVAKLTPDGTALSYCGYIGGSDAELSWGIDVDRNGNAFVGARTMSSEATFPVAVGPDLTYNDGSTPSGDAFVAKVAATGATLDYCGYIGGRSSDSAWGIDIDGDGRAYVAGTTTSTQISFPVTVGPDLSYNGGLRGDAFVARIEPSGAALS